MDDQPARLDIPYFLHKPQQHLRAIKWCGPHWAYLMFSLKDRGLSDKIAPDAATLNQKLLRGEGDPCWEACNTINMGALEIFGPNKVIEEFKGCPVCAFEHITDHIADGMALKYGSTH